MILTIGNFEMARSVIGGDGMAYDMLSDCIVCVWIKWWSGRQFQKIRWS